MDPPETGDDGITYNRLFIGVDSYSRVVFAIPIANRKSQTIIDAMNEIIKMGYRPVTCLCDPAGEFVSAKTKKWFKSQNIRLYHTASIIHAPQAERVIRDLRNFVRRYQEAYVTNEWLEASHQFTLNHNRVKTRAHGEIPLDVMQNSEADARAFQTLYGNNVKRPRLEKGVGKELPKQGTLVRLSRLKWPHEKESSHKGSWTKELFKISSIDTAQAKPMFQLDDLMNKTVRGKAYKYVSPHIVGIGISTTDIVSEKRYRKSYLKRLSGEILSGKLIKFYTRVKWTVC
jgi:hypothetical protein